MSKDQCAIQCPHGTGFNCLVCWPRDKRHRLFDREFVVVAEFPNDDEGTIQANEYMLVHDVGVLEIKDDRVILASMQDQGVPVSQRPSELAQSI